MILVVEFEGSWQDLGELASEGLCSQGAFKLFLVSVLTSPRQEGCLRKETLWAEVGCPQGCLPSWQYVGPTAM